MSFVPPSQEPATESRDARLIHALYSGLARDFVIELPPCTDLETAPESPSQVTLDALRDWFQKADQQVQVHQLRQFLQNSPLVTNDGLRALLRFHLRKGESNSADRDKVEFLLVQYFSSCAPARLEDSKVTLAYVAEILQPVLGTSDSNLPEWLQPLEGLVQKATECASLNELLSAGILESGRKLKATEGQDLSQPVVFTAFTHFNFLLRRTFFRLMHKDLNTILDGLRSLEQQGVTTLDCRKAQFSAEEPVVRLRMICQSWKVMFQAEYSTGQPLRMLVDIRSAVDSALEQTRAAKPEVAPKALAAAAASTADAAPKAETKAAAEPKAEQRSEQKHESHEKSSNRKHRNRK